MIAHVFSEQTKTGRPAVARRRCTGCAEWRESQAVCIRLLLVSGGFGRCIRDATRRHPRDQLHRQICRTAGYFAQAALPMLLMMDDGVHREPSLLHLAETKTVGRTHKKRTNQEFWCSDWSNTPTTQRTKSFLKRPAMPSQFKSPLLFWVADTGADFFCRWWILVEVPDVDVAEKNSGSNHSANRWLATAWGLSPQCGLPSG